jgi:hypothetical protein
VPIRIRAVGWAVAGALALAAIVAGWMGAFDAASAELLTAAVVILATAWWVHGWRRLWLDERPDRGGRLA